MTRLLLSSYVNQYSICYTAWEITPFSGFCGMVGLLAAYNKLIELFTDLLHKIDA